MLRLGVMAGWYQAENTTAQKNVKMKTKEEIIKNSLKVNENYQVNSIIDQITEGLNQEVQKGHDSFEYVFRVGSYNAAVKMSKHVAARLNTMGFYARFGWRETTPNGNERPIVVVMLERPPHTPMWKTKSFWFLTVLGTLILLFIIALISKP